MRSKIFLDTEFSGLTQDAQLMSIGLISESGRTFYAEFNDFDIKKVNDWVKENVLKNLRFAPPKEGEQEHYSATRSPNNPSGIDLYKDYNVELRGDKDTIRNELIHWLKQFDSVEIWADVLAYDWVLFCELFGGAYELPSMIYYIPVEFSTYLRCLGYDPDVSREAFARDGRCVPDSVDRRHNALFDAGILLECYFRTLKELGGMRNGEEGTCMVKG